MKYKIDKNVPLRGRSKNPLLLLIEKMEVGDSILFEESKRQHVFTHAKKQEGKKFVTRKEDDSMRRIWRIK
jgi:hypothetical protein